MGSLRPLAAIQFTAPLFSSILVGGYASCAGRNFMVSINLSHCDAATGLPRVSGEDAPRVPETPGFGQGLKKGVMKVVDFVDDWTSPRETTHGDLPAPSYVQSCFSALSMGYVFGGIKGSVASVVASSVGIFVASKSKSTGLGMVAGGVTRAVMGGLMGLGGGPAGVFAGVVSGALVGVFQVIRGNAEADIRDTAGNTNLMSGLFIPGTSKISAGLGSAIACKISDSRMVRSLAGAGIAMGIGAGLCAIGFSSVGLGTALVVNGVAGALGPFLGPRYSQLFRNLSNAIGGWVSSGAQKLHLIDKPLTETQKNIAGALPSSYLKEGLRCFVLSDGSLVAVALAGLNETVKQVQMFSHAKKKDVPGQPGTDTAIHNGDEGK